MLPSASGSCAETGHSEKGEMLKAFNTNVAFLD